MGTLTKYYVYSYVEPVSTNQYRLNSGQRDLFLPVQNPDGVTYWDYVSWDKDTTVTLTAEDLHIGDTSFTKDTIYRFEKERV